jgi:cell division septum initiation protein DivIVA
MLPPFELKNKKKFAVVLRGYSQTEVDEHVEYLIEKYSELYRRNDELERQVRMLTSKLDELETKEDAINRAIVGAQKLKDKIISEAEQEAELIRNGAKNSAARIISNFENKIKHEKAILHAMMEQIAEFKAQMLEAYETHISLLNEIAPDEADPEYDRSDSDYVARIMSDIRRAADDAAKEDMDAPMPELFEGGDPGEFAPIESPKETEEKAPAQVRRLKAKRVPKLSQRIEEIIEAESKKGAEESAKEDDADDSLKKLFSSGNSNNT